MPNVLGYPLFSVVNRAVPKSQCFPFQKAMVTRPFFCLGHHPFRSLPISRLATPAPANHISPPTSYPLLSVYDPISPYPQPVAEFLPLTTQSPPSPQNP
jgi:hypothetical protein